MKSKTMIGTFLAVTAVSLVAWSRWNNDKPRTADTALPLAVKVQVVAPSHIARDLGVSGTLVGEHEATVISETSGKVMAVKAQVGDWLNKGQIIVQVEDDLKLVALQQAQAQFEAAQTNHDKAVKDLARYEDLYQQQITTQSVLENARLAARAAEAQLKGAEAALKLAQRQYDDAAIKAPLAGRLADRYVNEATMVAPGDRIGVVVDNRKMKLETSVAENEVALVQEGQKAEVFADALAETKFTGRVLSVAQKANGERTYPVEILVQNDEQESLKSGMFGRASIRVAEAGDAIVVPATAVLSEAGRNYVFVEQNGVAHRVEVQLGLRQNGSVQVASGLAPGARVVISGQQRLSDAARVVVED